MHLLLRSKHIAPNPHIARAPELVIQNTTINSSLYQEDADVSSFRHVAVPSFILNGIPFVVRVRPFFRAVLSTTVPYSCTYLLYMCSKKKHKADHGHKKGRAPRAQEGL